MKLAITAESVREGGGFTFGDELFERRALVGETRSISLIMSSRVTILTLAI